MTTTLIGNVIFGLTVFLALSALLNWMHRRHQRMRRYQAAITTAVRGLQPATTAKLPLSDAA